MTQASTPAEVVAILQQYIKPPEPFITRLKWSESSLSWPCGRVPATALSSAYPMRASWAGNQTPTCVQLRGQPVSSVLRQHADDPLVAKYIAMCEGEGLDLAGIEFVEDADGNRYTYDINGTTNYSGVFAEQVGIEGMWEVAKYIRGLVAIDSDVIELQALGLK